MELRAQVGRTQQDNASLLWVMQAYPLWRKCYKEVERLLCRVHTDPRASQHPYHEEALPSVETLDWFLSKAEEDLASEPCGRVRRVAQRLWGA